MKEQNTISIHTPSEGYVFSDTNKYRTDTGYGVVYQVKYSKGMYDDFSCWNGDTVYLRKEDAEKELANFLEENSVEKLMTKFKVTDYEFWENGGYDYEKDFPKLKERFPNMSESELTDALNADSDLYWNHLNIYSRYNYELCSIVVLKLKL